MFDKQLYEANSEKSFTTERDAIRDYLQQSEKWQWDPSKLFINKAYITANPDLVSEGMPPLVHYLRHSQKIKYQATGENNSKIVVYTAISGGYDNLRDPLIVSPDVDYIVFTDNENLNSKIWKKHRFDYINSDPTRTARFIKTHPHLYLSDYDHSIWVDANLQLNVDPRAMIEDFDAQTQFVTWHHPIRTSIYTEAAECIKRKKDDAAIIEDQVNRYRAQDFPENVELYETSVIYRKHNDDDVKTCMNLWWQEINNGSRRDQIGLVYALQKKPLRVDYWARQGICMRTDPRFVYNNHS